MGLKDAIISWLFDNIRISQYKVNELVNIADRDKDGFITMRELYQTYTEWRGKQ